MAIEGYVRIEVRAKETPSDNDCADLIVRSYAAAQFCVPYCKFSSDWLNLMINDIPGQPSRAIENYYDVRPEYLGDPRVPAGPILQQTNKDRL